MIIFAILLGLSLVAASDGNRVNSQPTSREMYIERGGGHLR